MTAQLRAGAATRCRPARDDAHRRPQGRHRGAHRGAQPVHERGGRHGAARHAGACARGLRDRRRVQAKLTRYERQQILMATAEKLAARREEIADLITAESGLCMKDSLYEVGRAYDVFSLSGQLAIKDDGEIFSCDITPHGKARRIYTTRQPLLGVISAITPFNHPLNMVAHKVAPAIATNNRVVLKPTELTPLTALAAGRRPLRGGTAAGDAVGRNRPAGGYRRRDDHQSEHRPDHLHRQRRGRQVHRREGGLPPHGARARRQRSADRHGGCRYSTRRRSSR